jgi:hypothetical protein
MGKARPGFTLENTFNFAPGATLPSTRSTPESQRAYPGASIKTGQTTPGSALISELAS